MEPVLDASMYFRFGRSRRPEVTAATTFEAVVRGERTSTTRFRKDGPDQYRRWQAVRPGDLVRLWAGPMVSGQFTGRTCLVEITTTPMEVDLETMDRQAWSEAEGWIEEFVDVLLVRGYRRGLQVRYRLHTPPTEPQPQFELF